MTNYFTEIDVLGEEVTLEINKNSSYKTYFGAFLSFLCFAFGLTVTILIGREIYERKNPNVSLSEVLSKDNRIFLKDFPIYSAMFSPAGQPYNINEYIDFKIENVISDEKGAVRLETKSLEFIECKEVIPKYSDKNKAMMIESMMSFGIPVVCLNFEPHYYIKGEGGELNASLLRLNGHFCDVSDPKRSCKPYPPGAVIFFYNLLNFVNSLNYKNPISIKQELFSIEPSLGVVKIYLIFVKKNILSSDVGWIFEDNFEENYLNISSIEKEIIFTNELPNEHPSKRLFFSSLFFSLDVVIKQTRIYLKIQELCARIGGIYSFILIEISTLYHPIKRFNYLNHLKEIFVKQSELSGYLSRSNFQSISKFSIINKVKENTIKLNQNNIQINNVENRKQDENVDSSIFNLTKQRALNNLQNEKNQQQNQNQGNNLLNPSPEIKKIEENLNLNVDRNGKLKELKSEDVSFFEYIYYYKCSCSKDSISYVQYLNFYEEIHDALDIKSIIKY